MFSSLVCGFVRVSVNDPTAGHTAGSPLWAARCDAAQAKLNVRSLCFGMESVKSVVTGLLARAGQKPVIGR